MGRDVEVRLSLADDGALFRDGLMLLLQAAGHDVVHCTADGDRMAQLLADEMVDVAILDVRMPPGPEGGLVTARRLRAQYPQLGLLLLSHHAERHFLSRILDIGSERIGYRLKDRLSGVTALDDTLVRIVSGEIVIEPSSVDRVRELQGHAVRTGQELRVSRHMGAGMFDPGTAAELPESWTAVERQV